MIIALSGGVGGAKLVRGLANLLSPEELTIVVNTGDDFTYLNLAISPDLDSVMYAIAGIHDAKRGWGLAHETWHCMEALRELNHENWFQLGDKDLATHLMRTELLQQGQSLSEATKTLCRRFGIFNSIVPMTNDKVSTLIHTQEESLSFQEYFVKRSCAPIVRQISYLGIEGAKPSSEFVQAFNHPHLQAVVICPSNPFLSIFPMLHLRGIRQRLVHVNVPIIAVSPLIAGASVKGPLSKLMTELNHEVSIASVAEYYQDFLTDLVIDPLDAHMQKKLPNSIHAHVNPILMNTLEESIQLANFIIGLL